MVTVLTHYSAMAKTTTIFMYQSSSKDGIEMAGEPALDMICEFAASRDLNYARCHSSYRMQAATNAQYESPEKLPSTSDATSLHSRRMHHHVQVWCDNNISSNDWGWTKSTHFL